MEPRLFVGVDAGGSRTRALASESRGSASRRGEAGPANLRSIGVEGARLALLAAIDAAVDGRRDRVAGLVAGCAGAGDPRLAEELREVLSGDLPGARIRIVTDLEIALHGAFADGSGMILVVGTGSAAIGRDARGRVLRAGGAGPLAGDGGSGHDLGRRALFALAEAGPGAGEIDPFLAGIPRQLALRDRTEALGLIDAGPAAQATVAALAPFVVTNAAAGNAIAADLVRGAVESLVALVTELSRTLGDEVDRLALVGGLVEADGPYREAVGTVLSRRLPEMRIVRPRTSALEAALELACPD